MKTTKSGSFPPNLTPEIHSYSHFWIRNHQEEIKEKPPNLQYRAMEKSELAEIKALHKEWFPINYSDSLFDMIGGSLHSIVAIFDTRDYGGSESEIIVAGIVLFRLSLNASNNLLRCTYLWQDTYSAYIVTIGVVEELRGLGIASELISRCQSSCEEFTERPLYLYLHVAAYNYEAIPFYEKRGFLRADHISEHYYIDGKFYDAYLYVLYINHAKTPVLTVDNLVKLFKSVLNFSARVKSLFINKKYN